jgi:hypothetical protein
VPEILARCGYRCDLCLAYRPNVEKHPANQQILSDGWRRYFGIDLPAESIICDGCLSHDGHLIDRACPVRPCATEKGLANCGQCGDYGCERLTQRWVVFEDVQQRMGAAISPEDRARFIAPYENKRRLDALRSRAP